MSEISLILVLLKKTNKTLNDMAKVQIKSEKLTPFGGIFSIMEQFDALLAQTIDSTLGLRCTLFGYQYSEILRSLIPAPVRCLSLKSPWLLPSVRACPSASLPAA